MITQIRPIFMNDLDAAADSAVIVHELRLDFREGDRHDSVCVAMDEAMVRSLEAVLNRAMLKESNLRSNGQFNYMRPLSP